MKKRYFLFCSILSFALHLGAQQRYYVRSDASGTNNGLSWTDAFTDLQNALSAAQAGDEIWVAQGSYKPSSGTDRGVSFEPKSGLRLIGGFAGTETLLNERDWQAHPVELSGDIGVAGDSTDNVYNVMYLLEPDSNTLIDGFYIRYGNADYSGTAVFRDRRQCGGGLYIMAGEMDAYAEIRNCVFEHNTARSHGGGLIENSTGEGSAGCLIQHCRFIQNRSLANGGGLARFGNSWIDRGVELEDCWFEGNFAKLKGGGMYYTDYDGSNVLQMEDCTFTSNRANDSGGGAYWVLGKPYGAEAVINRIVFSNNASPKSAAMEINQSFIGSTKTIFIDSCVIKDHTNASIQQSIVLIAPQCYPLGIVNMNRFHVLNNVGYILISPDNEATLLMENINIENNLNWHGLNAIARNFVGLNKCRIVNNTYSFILYLQSSQRRAQIENMLSYDNTLNLNYNNNRFWDITSDTFYCFNSLVCLKDSLWESSRMDVNTSSFVNSIFIINFSFTKELLFLHNSNISTTVLDTTGFPEDLYGVYATLGPGFYTGIDPMFRDSAAGDYRLQPCSPLINAGTNSVVYPGETDLNGAPRIAGGKVDIGPYESPGIVLAVPPTVTPACPGAHAGSLAFNPDEGCPPYTYAWYHPADGSSGTRLDSLLAGQYYFTLTDARGNLLPDTILIPESTAPALSSVTAPAFCSSGTGGSISLQVTGGTPPYTYQWSDDATQNGSQRLNLPPGSYTYTLSDAAGCRDSAALQLSTQGLLQLSASGTPVSCFGLSDGSLNIHTVGGIEPVLYNWSPVAQQSGELNGLPAGFYSLSATDAWGCSVEMMFEVSQPDSLQFGAVIQDATTVAPNSGSINVAPISGGNPPYTVNWDNGLTNNPLSGLAAGDYTVTVRDSKGCSSAWTFTVELVLSAGAPVGKMILLYPNPAADHTNLSGDLPAGIRLDLLDAQGRLLRVLNYQPGTPIDLSDLPAGIYWLRAEGVGVGKVVKG